jgi:ribonuclease HII
MAYLSVETIAIRREAKGRPGQTVMKGASLAPFCCLLFHISTIWRDKVSSFVQLDMKANPLSSMETERQLRKRGFSYILGSDDAGTGSIAGPIVVASCMLLRDKIDPIEGVNDSKLVPKEDLKRIYDMITSRPEAYAWNTMIIPTQDIEEVNIPASVKDGFRRSIESLVQSFEIPLDKAYSIVDGHRSPKLAIPIKCRPWVKGDSQVYTVALSSILARYTHLEIMRELHDAFPQYGFARHNGYPTKEHIQALHSYGPCPVHRKHAKPVKRRWQE